MRSTSGPHSGAFAAFSRFEPTPERTAFVRFRRLLVARQLDQVLFERVNRELRARAVTVKTGTLVDATVIASASEEDREAGWSGHRAQGGPQLQGACRGRRRYRPGRARRRRALQRP
jgi:IS5 family transposase